MKASERPRPVAAHELTLLDPARHPEVARAGLRSWLVSLLAEVAPGGGSFAVRFAGDPTLRRLNRDFRGQDRPTDVLSFPGETGPEGRHLGDVVISVAAARRQAAELGHAVERELRILTLHGLLHCLGHDHESDDGTMDRLERRLRRRWLDHG